MEMKLKKEEVYVEVATQEEADKAKEMLLKYGESVLEDCSDFEVAKDIGYIYLLLLEDVWFVGKKHEHKTKVTIEQLEEILSRKTKSQRITALEAEVKELMERIVKLESPNQTTFCSPNKVSIVFSDTIEKQEPKFEVGMFVAFSIEGIDYWIYGELEEIDNDRNYKFKCSNRVWYENFRPIKEIIWE